jgi:hypothetical protein
MRNLKNKMVQVDMNVKNLKALFGKRQKTLKINSQQMG